MIHDALHHVLSADPAAEPIDGVEPWWARHRARAASIETSFGRALVGGFCADRIGWAFSSGYQEALGALVPSLRGTRAALCATEGSPGAHPRSIETTLRDGALNGKKSYVTLGGAAERLLVVASEGERPNGQRRLAVVIVPADRAGLSLESRPPTPFVPEVPHARLVLSDVRTEPEERLAGDGYVEVLKPFRTVEDVHVYGAILGYLLQVARRAEAPDELRDAMVVLLGAGASIAAMPPLDPAAHVALGALIARSAAVVEQLAPVWQRVPEPERERWERDRVLLSIASAARDKRLAAARAALGG